MAEEKKLTKKQLKAQAFRQKPAEKVSTTTTTEEPPKKKRKTRRGKKNKQSSSGGNRFLVFVGSLAPGVTPAELQTHFKKSAPDHIRLRADKHIAFLEFDPRAGQHDIQRRMDTALLQHGTELRGKRINVELTVGGGGNSADRVRKLRDKNAALDAERKSRLQAMMARGKNSTTTTPPPPAGMHPERAKLLASRR